MRLESLMRISQLPKMKTKQSRIQGNPVADDWARAVMRKPLEIQQGRIHGNPVTDGWAGAVMQKISRNSEV